MLREIRLWKWMVVLWISDDRRLTPENEQKCTYRLPVQFVLAETPQFSDFFWKTSKAMFHIGSSDIFQNAVNTVDPITTSGEPGSKMYGPAVPASGGHAHGVHGPGEHAHGYAHLVQGPHGHHSLPAQVRLFLG